jgi:hypothetical protein
VTCWQRWWRTTANTAPRWLRCGHTEDRDERPAGVTGPRLLGRGDHADRPGRNTFKRILLQHLLRCADIDRPAHLGRSARRALAP